jgi:hypothetical protein
MSKIHSFLTYVLPLLAAIGLLQIFLLAFSKEKRIKINFGILTILAFASIRPNILGESFGLIGPLYFLLLNRFAKDKPGSQIPDPGQVRIARNTLMILWVITFIFWICQGLSSSFRTYSFAPWPPIANLGTIGLDGYFLLEIFKLGRIHNVFRVFWLFIAFEAASGLISKYLFHYHVCVNVSAGRGWPYAVCLPGAILSSRVRLTGIGGEPAIFATYLSLLVIVAWWPVMKFKPLVALIVTCISAWASIVSGSTTGITEVLLAAALAPLQRLTFKKAPILLMLYSSVVYYVISTGVIKKATTSVVNAKLKSNAGSVTDRNLTLGLHDYLQAWGKFPFGSEWSSGAKAGSFHINLLADSLSFGPYVIFLFFLLLVVGVFFSPQRIQITSVGIIVFTTCLYIEPAWLNAIWFILIYMFFLVLLSKKVERGNPTAIIASQKTVI